MTTHDEKILQLLDRIHNTAQGRREKAVDGAVQTMERVNRTSYGALRDLTENGHKKARPAARPASAKTWMSQELPTDDDFVPRPPVLQAATAVATRAAPAVAEAVGEEAVFAAEAAEITQVSAALNEETAIMVAPLPPTAAPVVVPMEDRAHTPDAIVAGDGATYAGAGSQYQQTRVIWFRRLFGRR